MTASSLLKTLLIVILTLGFSSNYYAQYIDNFDMGSIESNGWEGDLEDFTMNANQQLQLMNEDPSSSNFSTLGRNLATGDSTSWEFYCKMEFAPSSSNYAEVLLALDAPSVSIGNGYVLRIGGISGDQDAIGLYKKEAGAYTLLAEGMPGGVGSDPVEFRVRVIRNADSFWELWIDYTGGSDFVLEGEAFDDTYKEGVYFGFSCIYSSTRADKFFYDDLIIGPEYVETNPPEVFQLNLDDPAHLLLSFTEPLDASTISNTSHYNFSPSVQIGMPTFVSGSSSQIDIPITGTLISDTNYQLDISGIQDLSGNVIEDTTLFFEYIELTSADFQDIIFNEIMADPSPRVGLPEYEFVELRNLSQKNIQLSELTFEDGNGSFSLPSFILRPDSYVVITDNEATDLLTLENAIGLNSFPSLTNSGEELTLSFDGTIIDRVQYSSSWYQDAARDNGGYTLELINPDRICEESENWGASQADIGGTPGLVNSINDTQSVPSFPEIINAFPINSSTIEVYFSQLLNIDFLEDIFSYDLENNSIIDAFVFQNGKAVRLTVGNDLIENEIHTLEILAPIINCKGQSFDQSLTWDVALPSNIQLGDLLINEILFNPRSGGKDFVEIINISDRVLSTEDLFFANRDEQGLLENASQLPADLIIFPNEIIAFSEDISNILTEYPDDDRPGRIIQSDLPSLPDNEGTILIYQENFPDIAILDEFDYLDDYHNPLLSNLNGVSLERLSTDLPTNEEENWKSATGSSDFGTPGAPNSQELFIPTDQESPFDLGNKRLSPDDDGFEDFLSIQYRGEAENFAVSIRIYNSAGQLIKIIANNESVGTSALFSWQGDAQSGDKVPLGIYILWAERFNATGVVQRFQESIVVAGFID